MIQRVGGGTEHDSSKSKSKNNDNNSNNKEIIQDQVIIIK